MGIPPLYQTMARRSVKGAGIHGMAVLTGNKGVFRGWGKLGFFSIEMADRISRGMLSLK